MTKEKQEAGMYAMFSNKDFPQVKVGKYTICRQNDKQIWIQEDDAEGGAFLDEMFEKAIEDFFNKHF